MACSVDLDRARAHNATLEGIPILDPWLLKVTQHPGSEPYRKWHDYLTLFTCTPYAVNTHRLLVRGERIAFTPEVAAAAAAPAQPSVWTLEPWMRWLIAGAAAGLVILLVILVRERRRARRLSRR